jgi:2-oxoacid:acceptor oxidoreductase delta subunit (pyruvate/2-ketoisovalerate family)
MGKSQERPVFPHLRSPVRPIKTGSWRTFKPVVDQEKCNSCLICWSCCPDGVIVKVEGELRVDYDYCKGCGICGNECPRAAIKMVRNS